MTYPVTVEELIVYPGVDASVDTAVLQAMLDAAEEAIAAVSGPAGDATEILDGGGSYIFLRRRCASVDDIDTVTETVSLTDTELDATDFRLRADGVSLLRLDAGANPRVCWGAPVTVEYTPEADEAERVRVQVALVMLDLNHIPGGITSEQIGAWMEQRAANSVWNYTAEREAILASLQPMAYAPGFA